MDDRTILSRFIFLAAAVGALSCFVGIKLTNLDKRLSVLERRVDALSQYAGALHDDIVK